MAKDSPKVTQVMPSKSPSITDKLVKAGLKWNREIPNPKPPKQRLADLTRILSVLSEFDNLELHVRNFGSESQEFARASALLRKANPDIEIRLSLSEAIERGLILRPGGKIVYSAESSGDRVRLDVAINLGPETVNADAVVLLEPIEDEEKLLAEFPIQVTTLCSEGSQALRETVEMNAARLRPYQEKVQASLTAEFWKTFLPVFKSSIQNFRATPKGWKRNDFDSEEAWQGYLCDRTETRWVS